MKIFATFALFYGFIFSALAEEDSSKLPIHLNDLFLQLSAKGAEGAQGGVETPHWKLGAEAHYSNSLELSTEIGAANLLYRPQWVAATQESISLLEVKGVYRTSLVDFYGGQFLLPWGSEGQRQEGELLFPRTLLYERGLFPLRDYGAGITAQTEGFYFNIVVHSGEGGGFQSVPSDNRVFTTGQWGYQSPTKASFGVSITDGRYLPSGSLTETKVRGGNAFFSFHLFDVISEVEGSLFQNFTGGVETDPFVWHGDLAYQLSDHVTLMARYEQYNPNTKMNLNIIGRGTAGLEFSNKATTSKVYLYFVKNNESQQEYPNDEFRIAWRITSL